MDNAQEPTSPVKNAQQKADTKVGKDVAFFVSKTTQTPAQNSAGV
jgi:hypothetical protein